MKHPIQNWVYYIIILLNSVKLIPLTPHFKLIFHLKIKKKIHKKKPTKKKKKNLAINQIPNQMVDPKIIKAKLSLVHGGYHWLAILGGMLSKKGDFKIKLSTSLIFFI